jgi:hypothetical protein
MAFDSNYAKLLAEYNEYFTKTQAILQELVDSFGNLNPKLKSAQLANRAKPLIKRKL